jgi:hypothetical protein
MAAVAVVRLRRLEAKVDGWRAEYRELQDAFAFARGEAGRLEGLLQGPGGVRQLEVDEKGGVFVRERPGGAGVRRTVGLVTTVDAGNAPREVVRYLDDPAFAARGRDIARLRREAAELAARRDGLAERITPVARLAAACRRERLARGWREGDNLTVQMPTTLTIRGAA